MTAEDRVAADTLEKIRRRAQEAWREAKPRDAMAAAWTALDLAADDRRTLNRLTSLLRHYPAELTPERRASYLRLLTDPANEPHTFNVAGWDLLLRSHRLSDDADDAAFAQLADAFSGVLHHLPDPERGWRKAQYNSKFPQDAGHRDLNSLIEFAREDMGATWGHFQFWCTRAPVAGSSPA